MAIKLAHIKIYRFRFLPVDSVLDEHPGLASTTGKVPFTLEETANTTRQPQDSQVGYTWLRAGSCAESVERSAWNS
jgi:hypothetical protein